MTALLAALLALASPPAAASEEHWDARLTEVAGTVLVHPGGGGEPAAAEAGMPLVEGDRVSVAEGGSAEIGLHGGSLIHLNAGSEFTLQALRRNDSLFRLDLGSLLAKIESLGTRRMRFQTPALVCAVRGTELGVEVEGDDAHVGVFDEGELEVRGETGEPLILRPNQEASVRRGQAAREPLMLKRFLVRRALMRQKRQRLQRVRAAWRQLPPAKRQELRRKAIERIRQRRQRRGDEPGPRRPGRRRPDERR